MRTEDSTIRKRAEACAACPLYDDESRVCDDSLWMNPRTLVLSGREKEGYVRGCGCYIPVKARKEDETCEAGRWER